MVKQGYKQTEIGVIPEDWEVVDVLSVSNLITKGTTPHKFTNSGVNFIKIESFVNNKIVKDYCVYINEVTHNSELKRSILKEGDILFAIAGATIGKCAIVHSEILPANTNQALAIVRVNKDKICTNYLFEVYKSQLMLEYIKENAIGGAQPNLNLEQVGKFQIPLPPLPEQEAIAEALSDADAWIESLEQLIAKKRLIKQGAMQELLTPPSHAEALEAWEVKKLGEVLKLKGGFAFKSEDFGEFGIPIIRISDINGLTVELDNSVCVGIENISKDFIAEYGDILIAMSGATTGKIGKYCYENKAYINQRVGKFDINDSSKYSKDFLYHSLFTKKFKDQLNKFLAQGAQPNVSGSQIEDIQLNFPKSLSEQERIATILSDMDAELEALEQQLGKARQIKQGMMQELLTGRVRLV